MADGRDMTGGRFNTNFSWNAWKERPWSSHMPTSGQVRALHGLSHLDGAQLRQDQLWGSSQVSKLTTRPWESVGGMEKRLWADFMQRQGGGSSREFDLRITAPGLTQPSGPPPSGAYQLDLLPGALRRDLVRTAGWSPALGVTVEPPTASGLGNRIGELFGILANLDAADQIPTGVGDMRRLSEIRSNIMGMSPIERARTLSEAMSIAQRYDNRVTVKDVQYLPDSEKQIGRLQHFVRRSDKYVLDRGSARKAKAEAGHLLEMMDQDLTVASQMHAAKDVRTGLSGWGEAYASLVGKSLRDFAGTHGLPGVRRLAQQLAGSGRQDIQALASVLQGAPDDQALLAAIGDPAGFPQGEIPTYSLAEHALMRAPERFYQMDRSGTERISDEIATLMAKREGYIDLALKTLKGHPDQYTELISELGIKASDANADTKAVKALLEVFDGKRSVKNQQVLKNLRHALPGLTNQQQFDIAAAEAMNLAFISKADQPGVWMENALAGFSHEQLTNLDPANPGRLRSAQSSTLREFEDAVRLRRIRLTPAGQTPNLDPVALRTEAIRTMHEVKRDSAYNHEISQYIAMNQANREARWRLAQKEQTPVFVRGIGEAKVNRISEFWLDKDKGIAKQVAEVSRIHHDPTTVFASGTAEDWQQILHTMSRGQAMDTPEQSLMGQLAARASSPVVTHAASVAMDMSTGAEVPRLVLPSILKGRIDLSSGDQAYHVADSLMRSWTPWLVPENARPEMMLNGWSAKSPRLERYGESLNRMYEAVAETMGPRLTTQMSREDAQRLMEENYRPILGRFFELNNMQPKSITEGLPKGLPDLVERSISALQKQGATADLSSQLDQSVVHELWQRARSTNAKLRQTGFADFQRAIHVITMSKHGVLSLDQPLFEDGVGGLANLLASNEANPEEMLLRREAQGELIVPNLSSRLPTDVMNENGWTPRSSLRLYRELTRRQKGQPALMEPIEALEELRRLGGGAEDFGLIMRSSPKAREVMGQLLANKGEFQVQSAEQIHLLREAGQRAGVKLGFQVRENGQVVASGMPTEERLGGVRIGSRLFMTGEEIKQNTYQLFLDDTDAEIRNRHGFVPGSSRIAGLDAGELPLVNLPGFDRGILSGRAWREGIDADATMLNVRAVARGKGALVFDTEFTDFGIQANSDLNQLLQIAWGKPGDAVTTLNVKPSAALQTHVQSTFEVYRQMEADLVTAQDVAARTAGTRSARAMAVQHEQDIMNALRFIGKLSPDANQRAMLDDAFLYERVGARQTAIGIRNLSTVESAVATALAHLNETGVSEGEAASQFLAATEGLVGIGVNAAGADIPVLRRALTRAGNKRGASAIGRMPLVEVDALARFIYPNGIAGKTSWGMENLINLLPAGHPARVAHGTSAHTAVTDVEAQGAVFGQLLSDMEATGIDPRNIPTFHAGDYLHTGGIRDLELGEGIYRLQGMGIVGEQYSLSVAKIAADGTESVLPPILRNSGTEVKSLLGQYGDVVPHLGQARQLQELAQWQNQNDTLSRTFNGSLYHLDRLLDAGAGGARSRATAEGLLAIPEGTVPLNVYRGQQLLALSPEAIAGMAGQEHTARQQAAGALLLRDGTMAPGHQALYDAYAQVEGTIRGMEHLSLTPGQAAPMRTDLITSLNEAVKARAAQREIVGRYSLGQLAINGHQVALSVDELNAPRSMWRNIQNVSDHVRLSLEADRKAEAARLIHAHLVERGLTEPLGQGQYSPSVDLMGMQAAIRVDRSQVARETDYVGLAQSHGQMGSDEAASLRTELMETIGKSQAAQAVAANPAAAAQRDAFTTAISELSGQGMRVPLPYHLTLPLSAQSGQGLIDIGEGRVVNAAGLAGQIDTTASTLSEMRLERAVLSHRMGGRPDLRAQHDWVTNQMNELQDSMHSLLRVARGESATNPELSHLLGLQEPGPNTMIMMGSSAFAGRRIQDLNIGELDFAEQAVMDSQAPNAELKAQVSGALRAVNEQIKERGLSERYDLPVGRALSGDIDAVVMPLRELAEGSAAQQAIRAAQTETPTVTTMAAEAVHAMGGESEYSMKRLIAGFDKIKPYMQARYILPAIGGAVIIGAMTLGGHDGMPRPNGHDAPAPDGNFDENMQSLAGRPLPPEITMGRQAYIEPNGGGMTVRLRTRGTQDPHHLTGMVQSALAGSHGHLSVTVRDDRQTLDRGWLSDQIQNLL